MLFLKRLETCNGHCAEEAGHFGVRHLKQHGRRKGIACDRNYDALRREGVQVRAYDPAAIAKSKELLGEKGIEYAKDAYDAIAGSDALLILTEWKEFSSLD